jgi:hypothetical protein
MKFISSIFSATFFAALTASVVMFAQDMPQTTHERVRETPTVKVEHVRGTVLYVEGNDLVVRMSNGGIREFNVPPSRKFMIDGKEMSLQQLQPSTQLVATVTTKSTPVTERTRTVGSGKVWWVNGNTVILTLPNGENHTYTVNDTFRFVVDGKPASVHELPRE